jgi:predicted O-methyltransferase YrrM
MTVEEKMIIPRKIKSFPSLADVKEPEMPTSEWFYKPYLGENQVVILCDLLMRLRPKTCLEWGSGFSTVFFAGLTPEAKWISIEHHPYFHEIIKACKPDNVFMILEPIWQRYIEIAKDSGLMYDFIFVDGERRPECIKFAADLMKDGSVIVQHDAGPEDKPIMVGTEDVRFRYRKHGVIDGLWWGIK